MIPEEREKSERRTSKDGGVYDAEQAIMHYLRMYVPASMLKDGSVREKVTEKCAQVAADFDMKRGIAKPEDGYSVLADNVIGRYIMNWNGKKPGDDDRGHRFGKGAIPQ